MYGKAIGLGAGGHRTSADAVAGGSRDAALSGAIVLGQDRRGSVASGSWCRSGGIAGQGSRWFRDAGGMSPYSWSRPGARYLSFAEREEIALLRVQGKGVRQIALALGRSPSTVSRELRRNSATRGGKLDYRASVAQWKAELFARRPKTANSLITNSFGNTFSIDYRGESPTRTAGSPLARRSEHGPAGTSRTARTGNGCRRGALSRSHGGCGSTSPRTSRCGSATKPSTRHCISKDGVL